MKPIHVAYAVAVLLLFQVFFRYSYTTDRAGPVYRIDRLTQRACIIGPIDRCDETPAPIPTPTVTPSLELEDQRAIETVQHRDDANGIVMHNAPVDGEKYTWKVFARYTNDGKSSSDILLATPSTDSKKPTSAPIFPVRIVWYGIWKKDGSGNGWAWEVHLDTHEVFPVFGNAALEAKYYGQPTSVPAASASAPARTGFDWDRLGK